MRGESLARSAGARGTGAREEGEKESEEEELDGDGGRRGRAAAEESEGVVRIVVDEPIVRCGEGHHGSAQVAGAQVGLVGEVGRGDGAADVVVPLEDGGHPILVGRDHVEHARRKVAEDAGQPGRRRVVVPPHVDELGLAVHDHRHVVRRHLDRCAGARVADLGAADATVAGEGRGRIDDRRRHRVVEGVQRCLGG